MRYCHIIFLLHWAPDDGRWGANDSQIRYIEVPTAQSSGSFSKSPVSNSAWSLCSDLESSEQQEPTYQLSLSPCDSLSKKPMYVCFFIICPCSVDTEQYFPHNLVTYSILCHKHSPKTFFLEPFVFMLQFVLVLLSKIYNENLRLQNHGISICYPLDMEFWFLYSMHSFKFIT